MLLEFSSLVMATFLPQTYLLGLTALLAIVALVVGRQFLQVRRDELNLVRLEREGGVAGSKDAATLYELGAVQLRKRLYPQAISSLRQAIRRLGNEPDEARAVIENALGFALAAQKDFEGAVKHYYAALRAKPEYPVALNNLAFAQERLLQPEKAECNYREAIRLDPGNRTARRRLARLERGKVLRPTSKQLPEPVEGKGF